MDYWYLFPQAKKLENCLSFLVFVIGGIPPGLKYDY
jgi:hypothetical protein